ncbi:glycosyltransferase family 4 protein [Geodermatophilus sp. SYSU D00965]
MRPDLRGSVEVAVPGRVVVLSHTAVLSGGEIALLEAMRCGALPGARVVSDEEGDFTAALRELPDVSVSVSAARSPRIGRRGRLISLIRRAWFVRREYADVLDDERPDTVYANTLRSALVAATLPRRSGRLFVFHVRDQLSEAYLGCVRAKIIRALLRRRVDAWIANSSSTLASIGALSTPHAVIPSPVADAFFEVPALAAPRVPAHVVMVGRLAQWKGQHRFLEALSLLNEVTTDWRATVAGGALFGEHDYEASLKRLARELRIDDRVHFAGHVVDVPGLMSDADVVVHCSQIPEPFGQVVVQAMAAARPVVAADAGGPAEVVRHGVTGLLVDAAEAADIAGAIARVIADPGAARAMARAARRDAEVYRAPAVSDAVNEFLRRLQ